MFGIIRSEIVKMRHTFSMNLMIAAPLATVLLGYLLSHYAVEYAAYNWWYTMILPIIVCLWSAGMVAREKNTGMQNIVCLPLRSEKIWLGKTMALAVVLFISNLFMWLICTATAYFTAINIPPLDSFVACMLLFLTYLWQLPLIMVLTSKIGYLPGVLISFAANIILSTIGANKTWFLFDPYAIPARVVCPFLKIYPNGLPLESDSPLLDIGSIVPAIVISLLLAALLLWGSPKLLRNGGSSRD